MLSKYSPGIVACSSVQAPNTLKGQTTFSLVSWSRNTQCTLGRLLPGGGKPFSPKPKIFEVKLFQLY